MMYFGSDNESGADQISAPSSQFDDETGMRDGYEIGDDWRAGEELPLKGVEQGGNESIRYYLIIVCLWSRQISMKVVHSL